MKVNNTKNILQRRDKLKIKLILQGTLVGFLVGIVIVLNRVLINIFTEIFNDFYKFGKSGIINGIIIITIFSIIGLIVGYFVKREPMISGSGIPQVEGILSKNIHVNWLKVLIYKFWGGILALSSGLSIGREGPSVQIGAAVAQGVSKGFKNTDVEERYLITSGASAGLSAQFNAPISGVIFALEEIHKNFSPLVLLSAMAASLGADFISKNLLGLEPAFVFENVSILPLKYYWILIIFGVILGISGKIFNHGILKFQELYNRFEKVPVQIKVMMPFILTAVVGFTFPVLLGGGHELICNLSIKDYSIVMLCVFLIFKHFLTYISFGSKVPGGIFLPLLLLGALLGNIIGLISCSLFKIPEIYLINFIILGMAGHFSSIVKAPITGIVLITEMTNSFEHLLALALVAIIAYITSDLLNNKAIYDSLLERLLVGKVQLRENKRKTIFEIPVVMGSAVEGKEIKDIVWPEACLLVAVKRGDKELIPKGNTEIVMGDYIVVLVDEENSDKIIDEVKKITT